MVITNEITVMGEDWTGSAEVAAATSEADGLVAVRVAPRGPTLHVPRRLFTRSENSSGEDTWLLPLRKEALSRFKSDTDTPVLRPNNPLVGEAALTIPLVEETLTVGTERVPVGTVRIVKTVDAREETVDEPLTRDEVTVERVAVGRVLDAPATVRYEGDVMIVPVMEETLVVEKRIVLREELHIRRTAVAYNAPVTVTVRRENVTVERSNANKGEEETNRITESRAPLSTE